MSTSGSLTQAQAEGGSGVGSGASMESQASSSFHQRRKRSESTGGLKNTAGNITRIVKKSSSNFLRKFVKNFDDKDAPPIPGAPTLTHTSKSPPPPNIATRAATAPELPTLSSPTRKQGRIGPLDTPPPLSPLLSQEIASHFSNTESAQAQYPHPTGDSPKNYRRHHQQNSSSVESWLKEAAASHEHLSALSPSDLAARMDVLAQNSAHPSERRPSGDALSCLSEDLAGIGHQLQGDDEDEEEELDEDEDEDMPANISNRLSKLYESGSIQMNQSQTSLYYSTKSTLSENEAAEIVSRRTSLAQDALGYSLGLSRGNSIRFSQYSLGSMHALQPFPGSVSGTGSTPSSPGFARSMTDYMDNRLVPRRPVSMFIAPSSCLTAEEDKNDTQSGVGSQEPSGGTSQIQSSTDTEHSIPVASSSSSATLRLHEPGTSGSGTGATLAVQSPRPVTICVYPEDTARIPNSSAISSVSSSTVMTAFLTPDMSPADQREATNALARRTARRCFDEDESFLKREDISEYLGTPKTFNRLVLTHYLDYFDFSDKRLDVAFRALCQKLVLKGETQEVDRILEAFAHRFVKCNPRTLLGGSDQSKDIVHAITYSILLLNTDLHIVQQSSKMSRSAFVKNTLQVVQAQSEAQQQDDSSSLMARVDPTGLGMPRSTTEESGYDGGLSPSMGITKKRTPSVKSWKSGHSQQTSGFGLGGLGHGGNGSNTKMGSDPNANGGYGNGKFWQQELEVLLKDIYAAVKQNQILLPTSPTALRTPNGRSKSNASLLSSPPTSPTSTGFGSSLFSSNRMSRLIYPSSSSALTSSQLQNQQQESAGGGGGAFGLGLAGRRNSVSARTRQLRNDAILRLNAQAQAQAQAQAHAQAHVQDTYQGSLDGESLSVSVPSSSNSQATARYSIAGSIFNEAFVLDLTSAKDPNKGPVSSKDLKDLAFTRSGGSQSQDSSSSRLSSITMATTHTHMNVSTANSTTATTPSASQNSLASLQSIVHTNPAVGQEDALQKASPLNYPLGPQECRAQLPQDMQELKEDLHLQHLGSRYRMEGILWRKHLLERSDKKAQHRAWRQLLVVLDPEQGTLSMFRSDGTLPQIQPPQPPQQAHHQQGHYQQHSSNALSNISFADSTAYPAPPVVDTSSNITNDPGVPLFDEIPLQHTITNILPPPGYSSSRKHVFAVQLYSGAVYLFQAKTPEECEAWARTCNYWAARTSKEPLVGGVVNMEYGWGRALDLVALSSQDDEQQDTSGSSMTNVDTIDSPLPPNSNASTSNASTSNVSIMSAAHTGTDYLNHPPSSSGSGARSGYFGGDASHRVRSASIKSGTRGSTSSASGMGGGGVGINTGGSSSTPLGDRITLFDWTAPMPTMSRSLLSEEDQMLGLRRYVAGLESEMEAHQEHRSPMTRLFPPKSNNYAKAFNNWERRSQHLLKEMIKYQIYIECLEQSLVHFQQMLQDFGIDRLLLKQEQVEEKSGKGLGESDVVLPPQRLLDQIEENECPRDSVEAELEQLVVHEGLASAIS